MSLQGDRDRAHVFAKLGCLILEGGIEIGFGEVLFPGDCSRIVRHGSESGDETTGFGQTWVSNFEAIYMYAQEERVHVNSSSSYVGTLCVECVLSFLPGTRTGWYEYDMPV